MTTQEFSGSLRLRDETENVDLFAGVRMWIEPGECGISINDGNGGPAESITFSDRLSAWIFGQIFALYRRKAHRRSRDLAIMRYERLTGDYSHYSQPLTERTI